MRAIQAESRSASAVMRRVGRGDIVECLQSVEDWERKGVR
jgi:hypothetical protein